MTRLYSVAFRYSTCHALALSDGADANPFYKSLIAANASSPKWNFHKYVITPGGKSVHSFYPTGQVRVVLGNGDHRFEILPDAPQ